MTTMRKTLSTALWLVTVSTVAARIQWRACQELLNATHAPYQCANLTVPLDYKDNSSKPLELNLLKFSAPKQPSKRSILFNPGGPGSAGRNSLHEFGPYLAAVTGNAHDIVTWDPRGTGVTLPVSCFPNATDRPLIDTYDLNSTNASISAAWKHAQILTSACKSALVDTGEFLGTVYAARDMERIINALDEDGLLRYYGASYGSALGQVFAAMFPEKVDKMVIDGVVNLQQYLSGRDIQGYSSIEAVWEGFLGACITRPSLCALAMRNTSTTNLHEQVDHLLNQLQTHPISLGPDPADQLTANALQTSIMVLLYDPAKWPTLASGLNLLLSPFNSNNNTNRTTMLKEIFLSASTTDPGPFPDLSQAETSEAIRCSDTFFRTTDETKVVPIVEDLFAMTPHFAASQANALTLVCPQWPFQAAERLTINNFNVRFRTPMLVVSNEFDPVTAIEGARNTTATFKDSVLLVQQGYGHTSLRQYSACKSAVVAAYFNQGKLPDPETVCLVDTPTFATQEEMAAAAARLYAGK